MELDYNDDPFSIGDLSIGGNIGNAELLDPFADSSLEGLIESSEEEDDITLDNSLRDNSSGSVQDLSQFDQDDFDEAFPSTPCFHVGTSLTLPLNALCLCYRIHFWEQSHQLT